jgi:DNA-binding LytR/AlgR family response regulator
MTARSFRDLPGYRLRHVGLAIAAWGAIATLFLVQRLLGLAFRGVDPVWDRLALEMAVTWGSWALVTPVILFAVRRLPLPSENPWRVLLHFPIGVGVALIHSLIVATITPLFLWRPSLLPIRDMFTGRLASAIAFETLIYFMVAAAYYAWIYATEADERRIAANQAELGRAQAQFEARRLEEERQRLTSQLEVGALPKEPAALAVPERDGVIQIPISSLDWLQAEDNYVRLHVGNRSHLIRTTLSSLEKRLAAAGFVRIHRSAMVRVGRISQLKRVGSDRYAVVLSNGTQLRVSRAHRKDVTAAIGTTLATH